MRLSRTTGGCGSLVHGDERSSSAKDDELGLAQVAIAALPQQPAKVPKREPGALLFAFEQLPVDHKMCGECSTRRVTLGNWRKGMMHRCATSSATRG